MKIEIEILDDLIHHGKHVEQIHSDMKKAGVPVRSQSEMIEEFVAEMVKTGKIPFEMMRLASIKKRIQKNPPEFSD